MINSVQFAYGDTRVHGCDCPLRRAGISVHIGSVADDVAGDYDDRVREVKGESRGEGTIPSPLARMVLRKMYQNYRQHDNEKKAQIVRAVFDEYEWDLW